MRLPGDKNVVSLYVNCYAKSAESVRYYTQLLVVDLTYKNSFSTHGSHSYERADLDHVW